MRGSLTSINWGVVEFVAFFIAFPCLWLLASVMLKWQSGWYALERKYRTTLLPPSQELFVASGHFGPIPFNKVLLVAPLPEGLFLEWAWLFSFKSKPVLIPCQFLRSATLEGLFKHTVLRLYVENIDIELRIGQDAFHKVPVPKAAG